MSRQTKLKSYKELLKGGKLPMRIIPMKNEDKDGLDDKWTKGRNRLDFPIVRAVVSGAPNSGKTQWIRNLALRKAKKGRPFKRILCVVTNELTKDWKGIPNVEIFEQVMPPAEELAKPDRLLVVDDVDFGDLSKDDQRLLIMAYRHYSSHYGLYVATTHHNLIDIPKTIRRSANLFVMFRQPDLEEMKKTLGKRAGLTSKRAEIVFDMLKDPWDHILVDMIQGSEFPLRLNSVHGIRFDKKG